VKLRDLFESPISDVSLLGNWERSSSFRDPRDRKLLQSPKAIQKMKVQWKYPEETMVNIICVNSADANKHTEEGEVTLDWLRQKMPRDFDQIEPLIKPSEINIIFTNNKGSERVPLTGWVMAHRFGHALQASHARANAAYYWGEAGRELTHYMFELMKVYHIGRPNWQLGRAKGFYDLATITPLRGLMHAIGTFRSARDKNIRNPLEFLYETFAQFVFTGKITFNEPPRSFRYGHHHYGCRDDDDYEMAGRYVDDLAYQLAEYFGVAVGYSEGKIFVM
jgi:hypothetical protein